MVAVVSTQKRSEGLASLIVEQKNQPSVQKSAEEQFKDNYLDVILKNSSSKLSKVNTFSDFVAVFQKTAKADYYYYSDGDKPILDYSQHRDTEYYLTLGEADYKKEFVKYCESRGCYSEDELQALNITGCSTMKQLETATADVIKKFSEKLVDMGAMTASFTDDESQKLASLTTYKEMACLNNPDKTPLEKARCLEKFVDRILTDEDISQYIDKKLRDKLADMPDALDIMTKRMEEEEAKQRELEKVCANIKEDFAVESPNDSYENIQKYKASLIAQYVA